MAETSSSTNCSPKGHPKGNSSTISALPNELLAHVFSFLPTRDLLHGVSDVNHTFRAVSAYNVTEIDTERIRKSKDHSSIHNTIQMKKLAGLSSTRLKTIRLVSSSKKMDLDLESVAAHALEHCPNLEKIDLENVHTFDPNFINTLTEHRGPMRSLSLCLYSFAKTTITFHNSPSLVVDLTYNSLFGDQLVSALAKNCSGLLALDVYVYPYYYLDKEGVRSLLTSAKDSLTDLTWHALGVDRETMRTVGRMECLERLDLIQVDQLDREGLREIVRLPRMKELSLDSWSGSSLKVEDYMEAFSGRLSGLVKLGLEDNCLERRLMGVIVEACPGLEEVCLVNRRSGLNERKGMNMVEDAGEKSRVCRCDHGDREHEKKKKSLEMVLRELRALVE